MLPENRALLEQILNGTKRCPQGHPLTVSNTYQRYKSNGAKDGRRCRICDRTRQRKRRTRRRGQRMNLMLVNDDDGHWYIIPADKLSHWDEVWMHGEDYEDGVLPDYVVERIDGPHRVRFERYEIV